MSETMELKHYRALFLSDVHLGTCGCRAGLLLEFLKYNDAETIYLVGDTVDGWRLRRAWHWPQPNNDVVQKLLRMARKGARVAYTPGNRDEFRRDFPGTHFGGVEALADAIHTAADGRRFPVVDGDQVDVVVRRARWLAYFGDWAYVTALSLNNGVNVIRRKLGLAYWPLSAWAKLRVKNAVNFIGKFEETLSAEARPHNVDGVICGHIHHAANHRDWGIQYVNSGDWVEGCTAVAEHHDGSFEAIRWTGKRKHVMGPANIADAHAAA